MRLNDIKYDLEVIIRQINALIDSADYTGPQIASIVEILNKDTISFSKLNIEIRYEEYKEDSGDYTIDIFDGGKRLIHVTVDETFI